MIPLVCLHVLGPRFRMTQLPKFCARISIYFIAMISVCPLPLYVLGERDQQFRENLNLSVISCIPMPKKAARVL